MTAPQFNPSWPGEYYPSAAYAPPPPPSAPQKSGWGTWMVIIGAFLATVVACVATVVQGMAGLIGLAYDSYVPPPTPTSEFFERVFNTLWQMTLVSVILDLVAFALSIVAAALRSAKMSLWVYAIVVVVCALCLLTWTSGFASIPTE